MKMSTLHFTRPTTQLDTYQLICSYLMKYNPITTAKYNPIINVAGNAVVTGIFWSIVPSPRFELLFSIAPASPGGVLAWVNKSPSSQRFYPNSHILQCSTARDNTA